MRDTAFIATKPLQILIAVSIIKQLGIEKTTCLVVTDSFYGARMVAARMNEVEWDLRDLNVIFKESIPEAYRFLRTNGFRSIFIDSDVGFKKYVSLTLLKLLHRDTHIYVYEEGNGTYRTDLYSGFKKYIFNRIGIGTHFGGCSLTDGIYVFDNNLYFNIFCDTKVDIINIYRSIIDDIINNFPLWAYITNYTEVNPNNNSVCNIYLSSWYIDYNFIKKLGSMNGDAFIKLHPHIKDSLTFDFVRTVARTAPAELVLLDLIRKYEKVNVFHHGTSSKRYIHSTRLNFIKIDSLNEQLA